MRHCANPINCRWPKCDCIEDLSNEPPQANAGLVTGRTLDDRPASGSPDIVDRLRAKAIRWEELTPDEQWQRNGYYVNMDDVEGAIRVLEAELYQAQWCDCSIGICRSETLSHRRCKNIRKRT